jgi:hypothetical protein
MWKGIIVKPGGQIEILQNSFVEDAINAVYADFPSGSGTIIDVSDAIFNRNFVAITIKNYSQPIAAYPFNIKKSIFTCRNIPFSGLSWPSYNTIAATCAQPNPLASPYCLQNYPTDVLKAPKSGEFSQTGIYLENVGLTQTPGTSPVYYDIKIGDYFGPPSPTIFDNLLFGIDALESNIICYQSVFQNTNYVFSSKKYFGGIGINSISNKDARRLMLTPPTPFNTLRKNKFYDCHHAINGWNIFECDIRNIDFRSTQGAIAKFNRGKFGITTLTAIRFITFLTALILMPCTVLLQVLATGNMPAL